MKNKIQTTYNDETYELAYNENFLLLARDNPVIVTLPNELKNWKLYFQFLTDGTRNQFSYTFAYDNNSVYYKLYGWYSDNISQNTKPDLHKSKDGSLQILVKFGTKANLYQDSRFLQLSIWKKII